MDGEVLFVFFILLAIYTGIGRAILLTDWSEELLYERNPLWKIPAMCLWPLYLVFIFICCIVVEIIDYAKAVRDWYKYGKHNRKRK
jgi:hypothetical protein